MARGAGRTYKKMPYASSASMAAGIRKAARYSAYAKARSYGGGRMRYRKRSAKEVGYVDLGTTTYNLDTTGDIVLLATIAQGASINQRIGKKARYKSVQFHGIVQAGTTGTVNEGALLLIYDRNPRGALPAITDILVTASSLAFNNTVNEGRFRILRRWDFAMAGNSTTPTTGKECVGFDEYVKLKGLPITFGSAGTGAIGDIEKGALYLVSVGATGAGNDAPLAYIQTRTRFYDE